MESGPRLIMTHYQFLSPYAVIHAWICKILAYFCNWQENSLVEVSQELGQPSEQ